MLPSSIYSFDGFCVGFDGAEIHVGHGYLFDQFMKENINNRIDRYGVILQNRFRFPLEVIESVVDKIGAERVGIQLYPFADFFYASDVDPEALGLYMFESLNKYNILYAHYVEPKQEVTF